MKAAHNICAVYGECAIAETTSCSWYAKFKDDNFDPEHAPPSSHPVEFGEGRLNQLLHKNSHIMTRKLAERIKCSHTAVGKDHCSLGKVQKCGAWVHHALSDNNNRQRATISASLLARHCSLDGHKQRFSYRNVPVDGKWCLCINMSSMGRLRMAIQEK